MSSADLNEQIESILRQHLRHLEDGGSLDMAADLRDYGLDSMSAISVLLDLEELLGMEFPDEYIDRSTFHSGDSLAAAISKLMDG